MLQRIFTGSYQDCKIGNLISISGDRGKSINFNGKAIPALAPKRKFWNIWHQNIGVLSEEENNRFYIEQYYKQVLKHVDIPRLLENEKDPILLCYEPSDMFCHRHIVAEFISLTYGIEVPEISISSNLEIIVHKRPEYVRTILEDVMTKEIDSKEPEL